MLLGRRWTTSVHNNNLLWELHFSTELKGVGRAALSDYTYVSGLTELPVERQCVGLVNG